MLSTNARMASGTSNTDDGASWETVLRFLETPTPADYSFEFDARIEEELGQPCDENLLVDEYLFKHPRCMPRQMIYSSKFQKAERKQVVDAAKHDIAKLSNPAKFLKLTELEMVQCLRRWKQVTHESAEPLVPIKEADVHALHPADLISGACTHYFYSATKYSCLKRPTRLRITENGCRWKQQGRIFPIRENGHTVAYKTYLSYVALKNGNSLQPHARKLSLDTIPSQSIDASTSRDVTVCKRRDRKWSLWTMEEVGLAEDIQSERIILRRGGRPRPFPVICRIVCKRDANASTPLHAKTKCKKPIPRREFHQEAEPLPCDIDKSSAVSTVPVISQAVVQPVSRLASTSTVSSCMMNAQDILEDEIIRALIYDLPYRKVTKPSTVR